MVKSLGKMKALITLILLVLPLGMWADELTEKAAQELAQQFVASHNTRKSAPTVTAAGQVSGLYVFNVSNNGGFVIVSNDDQTIPILGFGQSGNIDTEDLPDNMRAWLQGYADQIAWLKSNNDNENQNGNGKKARRKVGSHSTTAIAPLIMTHWNQTAPYNNLCPEIDGEKTVTGCVATTVAQIMYYHYAHNGFAAAANTAIPGYSTSALNKARESISLDVSGLSATTFDWENMQNSYTGSETTVQNTAVATLMQYCGSAMQMMYGLISNGGSSSYGESIPFALKHYFGYDGGVRYCYRKNYSYADWVDLIYGELAASRPVALGGQSCGGGHSFICDGYKYESETDYFHINWGWGGGSDDYFVLSVLQPWEQGIGGSSTLDGFNFGQAAVVGIQPPTDGTKDYCLSLEGLHLGGDDATKTSKTYTRNSSGDFNGISLYYIVYDYDYGENAFDVAVQLVDGSGEVVHTLDGANNQTKTWNQTIGGTVLDISIPSNVPDGTYYIKVMSRPYNATPVAWQECFDGDAHKLTAVIRGNTLTINVPIPANVLPSATLAVTGTPATGSEQTVTATITGGSGNYNGNVVLRVNDTPVMGQILNIAAGETVNMTFSYIPLEVGTHTLALYNRLTGGEQIGSSKDVEISTLVIANNAANTDNIKKNNGKTINVKLAGRTLYKDGKWNTLCLPFDLTLSGSPLNGADVRQLDNANFADGTMTLNFTAEGVVTTIEAGKPYIVKWSKAGDYDSDPSKYDISEPVFEDVTLKSGFVDFVSADEKIYFLGNFSAITLRGGNRERLYLGSNNKLYWPSANVTIGACRAFFQLNGIEAGTPAGVKEFVLNFGEDTETGIERVQDVQDVQGAIFNLAGQRLNKMQKGINIVNGKKLLVK